MFKLYFVTKVELSRMSVGSLCYVPHTSLLVLRLRYRSTLPKLIILSSIYNEFLHHRDFISVQSKFMQDF